MLAPKYDANGQLNYHYVLPTESLRDLVYRRLKQEFPELNYCCEWTDVRGFGIHLTVCAWKLPGTGMYHVPPSSRIYN